MAEKKGPPFQKRWLVLTAIAVLALIFLIPFIREGGARVDTTVEVVTRPAVLGNIEETVQASGEIAQAQSLPTQAKYSGVLAEILVTEGQQVQAGETLAAYDVDQLEEQLNLQLDQLAELDRQIQDTENGGSVSVEAPKAGLVKEVYAQRGSLAQQVVEEQGSLLILSCDGLLETQISLPQDSELEEGDTVTIYVGQSRETGTVEAIDREAGSMTVTFPDDEDYTLDLEAQVLTRQGDEIGTGPIAPHDPVTIDRQEGMVSQVAVQPGDQVEEGDLLLQLVIQDGDQAYLELLSSRQELVEEIFALRSFMDEPVIRAASTGVVRDLAVSAGGEIQAGQTLCSQESQENYYIEVEAPEEAMPRIQAGQTVRLTVEGQNAAYQGKVRSVEESAESGESKSCLVRVFLSDAPGLTVGQGVDATVILASAQDTLLVPAEAVQSQTDGAATVEVSYGDGLTRVISVTTGLCSEDYVQILSGLTEGDEVVVSSTVVETETFSFFQWEWVIGQTEEAVEPGDPDLADLPKTEVSGETAPSQE